MPVVTDEIGRKRVFEEVTSQPWTSYHGVPWTGSDPEVEGHELLAIWRSRGGMGAYHPPERAMCVTPEISDYIVDMHNLMLGHGGIDKVKAILEHND